MTEPEDLEEDLFADLYVFNADPPHLAGLSDVALFTDLDLQVRCR